MARWQPERADVIAEYAREVLAVHPHGRILVGVDGIERVERGSAPSGREAFASDLAAAIDAAGAPARTVAMDAFVASPPATEPERFVDETAFRAAVLTPFRRGEQPGLEGERAVLVVSGAFLHLGDLAGVWHTSAWIALPRAVAAERDARRLPDEDPAPWAALVERAFRRVDARKRANATFDLADADHPRRVFEDAC